MTDYIDSDYCKQCGRPYAIEDFDYCDSCLRDIEWKCEKGSNNKGDLMEQDVVTEVQGASFIEADIQFDVGSRKYILEPREDITAYELWNIYKLIESAKLNACVGETLYNKAKELKIDRHLKEI